MPSSRAAPVTMAQGPYCWPKVRPFLTTGLVLFFCHNTRAAALTAVPAINQVLLDVDMAGYSPTTVAAVGVETAVGAANPAFRR